MVKENWLPRLQSLKLESCRNLKIIPFLPPCLQILHVYHCLELMQLANLSPAVTYLSFQDCPKLTSLGILQRCMSLKKLNIYKCPMLRREEASLVEGVVQGDIVNCLPQVEISTDEPSLVFELVPQQAFSSIKHLTLEDCATVTIPNMEKLSSLHELHIIDCPDVELLPNLPVSLQLLEIMRCPKMKMKYEEGGSLHLDLKDCAAAAIPNLEKLSSLVTLTIKHCLDVESLPNLPVSLRELWIEGCPKLKMKYEECGPLHLDLKAAAIPNLEKLSSLVTLIISDCPDVESLPNLPVSLQTLCIKRCPKIKMKYEESGPLHLDLKAAAIPNLEKLSSLIRLSIEDCPDVESLPNLPFSLHTLQIDGCPKLKMKYEKGGPLHDTISRIRNIGFY